MHCLSLDENQGSETQVDTKKNLVFFLGEPT